MGVGTMEREKGEGGGGEGGVGVHSRCIVGVSRSAFTGPRKGPKTKN